MDVTEAIQGLGEPRLLETIDKLVELHIGDTVALPQVSQSHTSTPTMACLRLLAASSRRGSVKVPVTPFSIGGGS